MRENLTCRLMSGEWKRVPEENLPLATVNTHLSPIPRHSSTLLVILVDGFQKWEWLLKAAYKRLVEEFEKLDVQMNQEKTLPAMKLLAFWGLTIGGLKHAAVCGA
jgi:hypothetical protein